ncbi:hypothetical protein QJ48_28525 [Paenibacillus sp. A3]|uniref:ABC transporter ATP-binding protein n=1 Tax=Paenibacillus sp. A3 TaxID=1337054 RepID=UPI0006D5979E|nr:ATP-binding cassette domain-containing protein [Paenibacillus sp. A3]KPV56282.1 hypothetical protein QJ48_28525 [Paenibacillus sp. A3]
MRKAVDVRSLTKRYKVPVKQEGIGGALRGILRPEYRVNEAVKGIDIGIEPGETVGFIGPNGAGKTTVLKMCSGILFPTSGYVRILGHEPSLRKREYLRQISFVMGQRSQLWWDIPAIDSFALNRDIYEIPEKRFRQRVDDLSSALSVRPLLSVPLRNLSLGERMKMEIIGSLLHDPKIVFLDEPTIGLDLTSQRSLRSFVGEYSRSGGTTIMLTSHYMEDIVTLCRRIIVISEGRIVYDGSLEEAKRRMGGGQIVKVRFASLPEEEWLDQRRDVLMSCRDYDFTFRLERERVPDFIASTGRWMPVDISVEEPPIEDTIERLYGKENPHAEVT